LFESTPKSGAPSHSQQKSANGFDKLGDSDVETVRQPYDVEQTYVSFTALYAAHVIPMQFG
jgi:hypothetical protein